MNPPDLIPLSAAVLCEDCAQISASTGACLGCGSTAVVNLERLLNRKFAPAGESVEALEALLDEKQ